jgi:hypothetical protein
LKPSSSITTAEDDSTVFSLEEDVVFSPLEDDVLDTLEEDLLSLDAGLSLPVDEELPKSLSMSSRVSDDELDKVSSSGEVDEWSSEEQAEKMASERAAPTRIIFFFIVVLL